MSHSGECASRACTVLVVDDDEISREIVCESLRLAGMQATPAASGVEGRDIAASASFDLILMDLQMPEMSGLEATQAIREGSLNKSTRIVAFTANDSKENEAACQAAGFDGLISKGAGLSPAHMATTLGVLMYAPRTQWKDLALPVVPL